MSCRDLREFLRELARVFLFDDRTAAATLLI
jgi:hypothetical protein